MVSSTKTEAVIFATQAHPLLDTLCDQLAASKGQLNSRQFPDGETYLRIDTDIVNRNCIILADLSHPNEKYLPLIFLAATLKELGAASVGLIAPYLCYMRQDRRFVSGEAITSRIFAARLSQQVDWLVTVDPHLHRYHSLDEIYNIPTHVVQAAPVLAEWLQGQQSLLLVGPDEESEQWLSQISTISGHPYVIGEKRRHGDRRVNVTLPDLSAYQPSIAVIIDDVISSGQTLLSCLQALQNGGIKHIRCAAIHGIFADKSDDLLLQTGFEELITCNTVPHSSNKIDISPLLVTPILTCLQSQRGHSP